MVAPDYWVIVPAAGTGTRMQSALPKQYLPLAGYCVIDWALAPFVEHAACRGIVVALNANDAQWPHTRWAAHAKVHTVTGGAQRADSVLAGLRALRQQAIAADSWVLVHDAARPCLALGDLHALLAVARDEPVGALLATPITETIKRASADAATPRVLNTVPRDSLWRAQTPQMFKLGMLTDALQAAAAQQRMVTDEASAIEAMGMQPRLVAGRADNLKITMPDDLPMAERVLTRQ